MLAPTIRVLRDGAESRISSREVVPGDVMLLEAGDRMPADARLVEVHSLKCDEAPLTGESFPVEKSLSLLPADTAVGDRRNVVFTGTTVTYGRGKALVTSTGMHTEFGRIAEQVAAVNAEASPLEKRTEEIGRWLGLIALGVCGIAIAVSIVRAWAGGQLNIELVLTITMFAIALAVAAVPEALAAIVTGALAVGMHEMAKRNALVRRMPAVETLGCTTVICTDKTGTLTKGEMTTRRLFVGGRSIEVSGAGYAPAGTFDPPLPADDSAVRLMLTGGLLCSDALLSEDAGRWFVKGDSTEGALVVLAAKANIPQSRDADEHAEDCRTPVQLGAQADDHRSSHARWPSPRFRERGPRGPAGAMCVGATPRPATIAHRCGTGGNPGRKRGDGEGRAACPGNRVQGSWRGRDP